MSSHCRVHGRVVLSSFFGRFLCRRKKQRRFSITTSHHGRWMRRSHCLKLGCISTEQVECLRVRGRRLRSWVHCHERIARVCLHRASFSGEDQAGLWLAQTVALLLQVGGTLSLFEGVVMANKVLRLQKDIFINNYFTVWSKFNSLFTSLLQVLGRWWAVILPELIEEGLASSWKLSFRKKSTIAPLNIGVSTSAILRIHYNFVCRFAWCSVEEFWCALASTKSSYVCRPIWGIHHIKSSVVHRDVGVSPCAVGLVLPLIRKHRLLRVRHVAIVRAKEIAVVGTTLSSRSIPKWH